MDRLRTLFERYRHAQLLGALTLLLIADPFLSGLLGSTLLDLLLALTLVSAIIACATRRRHVVIGVSLAACVLVGSVVRTAQGIQVVNAGLSILAICFFGYVIALVLRSVFSDDQRVSVDTICGALSVYVLMGLWFAFAFGLLESSAPGSFSGIELGIGFSEYKRFFGFSFVTLTTLGYGNIVPLTPRADALAIAEAILGQVYLTVLIARLVSLHLVHNTQESKN